MNLLRRLLPGIALVIGTFLLSVGFQAFAAWSAPSGSAPANNANAPLNVGATAQSKSGSLTITAPGVMTAPTYCIGASCISAWPSSGGGTVTSVGAYQGLQTNTSNPFSTSGNIGLNIFGISSCTNSTTNKIYWNGTQLTCGTDQTGSGSISGSGSTNYLSKWTGGTSLGNSQIYDNGANVGIGTTNPQEKLEIAGHSYVSGLGKFGNLNAVNNGVALWGSPKGVLVGADNGLMVGIGLSRSGSTGIGVSNGNTPYGAMGFDAVSRNFTVSAFSGLDLSINSQSNIVIGAVKVGIGTGAPSQKLDVAGNGKFGRFYVGDSQYGINNPGIGTDGLNVGVTTQGVFAVTSGGPTYQPVYAADYYIANIGKWVSQLGGGGQWSTNGSSIYYNNGNVGIGTANPVQKLDVQGNINAGGWAIYMSNSGNYYYGDGANLAARMVGDFYAQKPWGSFSNVLANDYYIAAMGRWATSFSDLRLKENILPLAGVLDKIKQIRGVSFEWNGLYDAMGRPDPAGRRHVGAIAQEVETQFPELVTSSGDNEYKTIDYDGLTSILLEAIKELKAETDVLKADIGVLKAEIELLKAR